MARDLTICMRVTVFSVLLFASLNTVLANGLQQPFLTQEKSELDLDSRSWPEEVALLVDVGEFTESFSVNPPLEVSMIEFGESSQGLNKVGTARSSCYGSRSTNYSIPDNVCEWDVYSPISIGCAPSGKTITGMDLHLEITHTYVGDLEVILCNEASDHCVSLWDREGGSADDISETWSDVVNYNGEPVNQTWRVWARDCASGDTGYIDYWWIDLYYEDDPAELVIQDWDCESEPWAWGETARIDLDVENTGGETADTYIKVIASNDTTLWDSDDYIIFDWHAQIAPGAHWIRNDYTWTLPSSPYPNMPNNGTVYYYVHVGDPFDLRDYDSVTISTPLPDLTASLSVIGSNFNWGDTVGVEVGVDNISNVPTDRSFKVYLVISNDSNIQSSDYRLAEWTVSAGGTPWGCPQLRTYQAYRR